MGSVHVPFGFYYEGTGTVAVYVRAESTSGTISAKVRGRAIKFGAEVASFDTSQFTASRTGITACLLYTSPSPRDRQKSRMPSSA